MLEAIVTENGVKALLWSLVSSATERNCFEPSKMADKTCRAQARVFGEGSFNVSVIRDTDCGLPSSGVSGMKADQ